MGLFWIFAAVSIIAARNIFRAIRQSPTLNPLLTSRSRRQSYVSAQTKLMELAHSPSKRHAARPLTPRKHMQQYATLAVLPPINFTLPVPEELYTISSMDILPSIEYTSQEWREKFYLTSRLALLRKYGTNAVLARVARFEGIFQATTDFCTNHLPTTIIPDAEVRHIARFNVPAEGFVVPHMEVAPINFEDHTETTCRFLKWVIDYPPQTVSRMMHLVYPNTSHFSIEPIPVPSPDPSDTDPHVFHAMNWRPYGDDGLTDDYIPGVEPSIAIIVLPPWAMSPTDLDYFLSCADFPSDQQRDDYGLSASQALWARIWDSCHTTRSRFFVFTTYEVWVFGVFSLDWTRAWTSEIVSQDSTGPTVIECLFYWFAKAIVDPGDFVLPPPPD
ncbi:hypothetical protein C8T65DRAFT_825758 [Cerioporus squamosus]|nr:hypothetical protein C8T65DRAFT_825758 [Cerioporus squamosus]